MNVSNFATSGNDLIKFPRLGSFTAADKAEDTDASAQHLTFATDSLLLNKHKIVYAEVEKYAILQSRVDVLGEYASRMAKELARQLDDDIYTELAAVSTSAPDHTIAYANTPTSTLTKADFVEARRLLRVQNVEVNDGNLFLSINPSQEAAILQLADFVDADKWSSGSEIAKLNGVIGKAYGFNIVVSNLVDLGSVFYHREHVGFALQQLPDFRSDYSVKGAKFEVAIDQVYGVKAMQAGKTGVLVNG
jgi:N4-gp56 family major capsid protein